MYRKLHWKDERVKEDSFNLAAELVLMALVGILTLLGCKIYMSQPDKYSAAVLAKFIVLMFVFYSVIYCAITRTNGHHLVDMPESYGIYRVWRYVSMAPAFIIPLISWQRMLRARRHDVIEDAKRREKAEAYIRKLQNLSPEERFPEDAKQAIASCCHYQMELSKIPTTAFPGSATGYVEAIEKIPGMMQARKENEAIIFRFLATYKSADKKYCLGEYSLRVYGNKNMWIVLSNSFALANESRHDERERLDKRLEIMLNDKEHLEPLKRWFYTGRMDELIRRAEIAVRDPANFTTFDLENIAERYPLMVE